jgi:hypothetical protein
VFVDNPDGNAPVVLSTTRVLAARPCDANVTTPGVARVIVTVDGVTPLTNVHPAAINADIVLANRSIFVTPENVLCIFVPEAY